MVTHARVREITVDSSGAARGALYYDADGALQEQRAGVVVLACNGIGTPRLLLNSTSPRFPHGLANDTGLVGKNLMHHPCGMVVGFFEERFNADGAPPRGSTMQSQQFYESDPGRGFVRGYNLQIISPNEAPLATALGGLLSQTVPWAPAIIRSSGNATVMLPG